MDQGVVCERLFRREHQSPAGATDTQRAVNQYTVFSHIEGPVQSRFVHRLVGVEHNAFRIGHMIRTVNRILAGNAWAACIRIHHCRGKQADSVIHPVARQIPNIVGYNNGQELPGGPTASQRDGTAVRRVMHTRTNDRPLRVHNEVTVVDVTTVQRLGERQNNGQVRANIHSAIFRCHGNQAGLLGIELQFCAEVIVVVVPAITHRVLHVRDPDIHLGITRQRRVRREHRLGATDRPATRH